MVYEIMVCLLAGAGAGLGTGFAGLSAAAVISPMLITLLQVPAYQAVGIALASDVLASAVSAYTYGKSKNLDIKNGLVMLVSVLVFTAFGSFIASLVPNTTMGNFSVFMTTLLGVKFYCQTCDDNQGKAGLKERKNKNYPIAFMRDCNRVYLRFYRCRRRDDDAPAFNQRSGV